MLESIKDFDFKALSIDERTLLAHDIWESVREETEASPLSPEQMAELERRIAESDAGRVKHIPWEEVKQKLLARKRL